MNENYYEVLQVNKNASQEIIEKAYKTLVKKYHPDLQVDNQKIEFEEKIKKINEAYEVLSDSEKRKNYDLTLKQNEISINDYNDLIDENNNLKNEINYLKNNYNQNNTINNNHAQDSNLNYEINRKIDDAVNKAYYDAYIQDLKNRGYKIKYRKTFKDFVALIITILIIILIFIILWHIPFTKNYFIKLYEKNEIFKLFIDSISNIFK